MPKAWIPTLICAAPLVGVLAGTLCLGGCSPRHRPPAPPTAQAAATPQDCVRKRRTTGPAIGRRERVLVKPAGRVERVIPAVTRTVTRTVAVKPAWTEAVAVPALYKTVWRTQTTHGPVRIVETPARYRTVTERVLIAPAQTVWKRAAGRPVTGAASAGQSVYEATGEVVCRVLIPARYGLRTRREIVAPPVRRPMQGSPVLRRIAERVLVAPARTVVVVHPAITREEHETVVIVPERRVTLRTPPQFRVIGHDGRRPAPRARPGPPHVSRPPPCSCLTAQALGDQHDRHHPKAAS